MKAYLAGPDVFRPDAGQWAVQARAMCLEYGVEALVPLDGQANDAVGIYRQNIAMIARADAVLANLQPFRGAEPDSGTCFEVGYAVALGKPVIAYHTPRDCMVRRLAQRRHRSSPAQEQWLDAQGWTVEDFGLPVNLMLAVPGQLVEGGLRDALVALCSTAV